VVSVVWLILGLGVPSATWLIAYLIATGGAGFLLWRTAPTLRSRPAAGPAHAGKSPDPAPVVPSVSAPVSAPALAPEPVAPAAAVVTAPVTAEPVTAEPVPAPVTAAPVAPFVAPAVQPAAPDVWVIDGRPRFHRVDCVQLVGQPIEPIPASQALEDGFIPCSLCAPSGS